MQQYAEWLLAMAPQKDSHLALLLAQQAVHMTRARFAVELDFSEESLHQVDALVDALRSLLPPQWLADMSQQARKSTDLHKFSLLWGSYVGEVMRRQLDGQWLPISRRELRLDVFVLSIQLNGQKSQVQSALQVYRRLVDAKSTSIWSLYQQLQNG